MSNLKDETLAAAEEYTEASRWRDYIYEDKCDMPEDVQSQRPSDIPGNIALGYLAGATQSPLLERALQALEYIGQYHSHNADLQVIFATARKALAEIEEARRGRL